LSKRWALPNGFMPGPRIENYEYILVIRSYEIILTSGEGEIASSYVGAVAFETLVNDLTRANV
jgi:hypothetical protein